MKIAYIHYPVDIILCMIWSIILFPLVLLDGKGMLSILLGFPYIFFVPGYLLISALFPFRKTDNSIKKEVKIILSICFSIAIVPLFGFILNFTSWGIRVESIFVALIFYTIWIGFIGIFRWYKIPLRERGTLFIDFSNLKSENNVDKFLTIIVIISIIIVSSISVYVVLNPKEVEPFTEFYLFGPTGKAENYPTILTMGLNHSIILEIDNHEYKTVNYTINIFLINESGSENGNDSIVYNMWFLNKLNVTLKHTDINFNKQTPQWKKLYSFTINRTGKFKLAFLLFTTTTNEYFKDSDYKDQADFLVNASYKELYLWIDIYDRRPIANFTFLPDEPSTADIINFTYDPISPYSRIIWWQWDFGDGNTSNGKSTRLKFDGIDNYIDVGNDSNLQPINGTIEAWIFITESGDVRKIFVGSIADLRRHPNFYIAYNILILGIQNNKLTEYHYYNATKFIKNTWYHVAVTWDGYNVVFFINGLLKQIDNQSLIPAGNNDSKRIGGLNPPKVPNAFSGSIKDLRIYNRSLKEIEIHNNYIGNVTTNGLVSWWKMNDGGNICYDSIGNNDGIIHGADWINQAQHRYNHPGTYIVTLTVKNNYGQEHSTSKKITII